jgi:hypothetical protein
VWGGGQAHALQLAGGHGFDHRSPCMTSPSPSDRRFLDRRRMRMHVGLYLLPTALGLVLSIWVGLFAWWPLAINPMHAAVFFEGEAVPKGTLTRYAIVTTVLVNLLLLAVSVAVTYGILWARSERRYLKLLAGPSPTQPAAKPVPADVKKSAQIPR